MLKIILNNLKHFIITASILLAALTGVGLYLGVDIYLGDNPLAFKVGNEGPHIFFKDDKAQVNYIRGGREQGFSVERTEYDIDEIIPIKVHFNLDDTIFSVNVDTHIENPPVVYEDNQPIIAISDIESNYKTFRDFLIANKVIDAQLNWSFGQGHLVLVGDFVDRGASTTQVLWFIYKLEQAAKKQGGMVHFILGNHEIKNLQANYFDAPEKYFHIAAMMGKQQYDLFSDDSFLGRWLASKNTVEKINGHIFVHGGIHPDINQYDTSLEEINRIVRANYRTPYFPKKELSLENLLISTHDGTSWYRGYFSGDLSQETLTKGIDKFSAKAVVVGHTPKWNVSKMYDGKVLAINVKHPDDYRSSFPPRSSQGLLIHSNQYFRLSDDGKRQAI
ncbi:MAG: metallophosphoesterase [Kangiellaceae bacterium]|nr:metallophosphoesterase [Kangiellaceae bacterium]